MHVPDVGPAGACPLLILCRNLAVISAPCPSTTHSMPPSHPKIYTPSLSQLTQITRISVDNRDAAQKKWGITTPPPSLLRARRPSLNTSGATRTESAAHCRSCSE